ncbi:hypothetical protein DM860_001772 [Cuscuta australis]|uniref:Uncharacterized protein n=1 Tax=Cuscuta australis TaxID=267555 RepID=A0A328E9K3_9ASTE|nr:hypothetical protein DM860_001772 [Cuscuta australis]
MEVVQILDKTDSLLHSSAIPKSDFYHGKVLTQIFEVATSIMESKFVRIPPNEKRMLGEMIQDSSLLYFDSMFSLHWRKSLKVEMILLRHLPVSSLILKKLVALLLSYKASYKLVGKLGVIFLA